MAFYNRQVSINLAGANFGSGLRVSFDIEKTSEPSSNILKLGIYNLSQNTRNSLSNFNDLLVFSAGYQEHQGLKTAFIGNVAYVEHEIAKPEIITRIEAGDGLESQREATTSFSFDAGTSAKTVLDRIADDLGLTTRIIPGTVTDTFPHGFSYAGSVKDALDKITDRLKLEWSIQGNQLQIIPEGSSINNAPVLISFKSGLIEGFQRLKDIKDKLSETSPSPGFKFKVLLNATLEPGMSVLIDDPRYQGEYKIEKVRHQGDTHQGDFTTDCEVTEVTGASNA